MAATQPPPAAASSSDWHKVEGGGIRLITSGLPDAQGQLRGILEIDLKPGWKTYWRDPGDAGVPPQVDVSKSAVFASATIDYPAPQRHSDGLTTWAGYDQPVALPVTFTLKDTQQTGPIEADVFLGICETICIPVQANIVLDPAADPENFEDQAAVTTAFDALPEPASSGFGARILAGDGKALAVEATLPSGAGTAALYLAGADGYMFGTPERREEGGKVLFSVPVLDKPAGVPAGRGLHYTLVAGGKAVSGTLPYF